MNPHPELRNIWQSSSIISSYSATAGELLQLLLLSLKKEDFVFRLSYKNQG